MSDSGSSKTDYYERNKEARRAYQRAYYAEKRAEMRRQREVEGYLEPEKRKKYLTYQREYYFANRERLLRIRRERYLAARQAKSAE
jgi:hypothetical protein